MANDYFNVTNEFSATAHSQGRLAVRQYSQRALVEESHLSCLWKLFGPKGVEYVFIRLCVRV